MVLLPIRIWRGQTRVWRFTVWELDTDEAKDISDYDGIEFQVKKAVGDDDAPLISKDLASGIVRLAQSGDTLGQLEVTCDPADTASLEAGVLVYDLWGIVGSARYLLARPADFTLEEVVNGP